MACHGTEVVLTKLTASSNPKLNKQNAWNSMEYNTETNARGTFKGLILAWNTMEYHECLINSDTHGTSKGLRMAWKSMQ